MTVAEFLNKVNAVIINPLIILLFAIAFLILFWGIFQFIASDSKNREDGKKKILYGIIGMFIMFSVYGLMRIVLGTFGINTPTYLQDPPKRPI